mmetsp:Transcript_12985/g.19314  ORF Transcript_12985/g.19314 Transcript_12985/m.19314 type:complete len:514 (+) Transcript_12985:1584-3125(+)
MLKITGVPGLQRTRPKRSSLERSWTPSSRILASMDERNVMTWKAPCLVCGKMNKDGRGIFCHNFFTNKSSFPLCRAAYCGGCYRAYEDFPFPIQKTLEEEEEEENGFVTEETRKGRFLSARDGDHIMGCPFECDLCQFRNVAHRDVMWEDPDDIYMLACIRRASLDAMWSREKDTVEGNAYRMRLDLKKAMARFAIAALLPKLGNPEMEDKVGMGIALITLEASLRPGRHTNHLQWESMRKTATWFKHAWEAITGNEDGGSVYASDNKTMYATDCPTRGMWYKSFLLGAKKRMGMIRKQDEALTLAQLMVFLEVVEEEWSRASERKELKSLEEVAAFVCIGYCVSLRGEEVPLTSIKGLLELWKETLEHETPHIMLPLRGKFKGEDNFKWHLIPIADNTRSNIPTRRWVSRLLIRRCVEEGQREGPLFAKADGTPASLGMYDPTFRRLLEKAKEAHPRAFSVKTMVEDYSLRRSLRRGSATEAQDNEVPGATIEWLTRGGSERKPKELNQAYP